MTDRMIKSFCWKADGRILFKIESIYHHLENDSQKENIKTENGIIEINCVEESDMCFLSNNMTLQLIDNTPYWVSFSHEKRLFDSKSLQQLISNSGIDGRGIFNSQNYVGDLDIGISDFVVAVKSKKINYDKDFTFLRNEISSFCSDLLSRSSSYYTEHFSKASAEHTEKLNYSEIAYLRDALSPDKFPHWIDYFLTHAEHSYEIHRKNVNLSEADEVESDRYLDALQSDNLFRTTKVVGNAGRLGYAPIEVDVDVLEESYDTKENQFVKFFVFYVRDFLTDCLEVISQDNFKLKNELEKMCRILDEKTEHPFWNRISDLDSIPFNSQVLQKKYPYNLIFQTYNEMQFSSEISMGDADKSYAVGQKDAPMLYQYWVFITLFNHLREKYHDRYITSDWISYDGKNLTFTLREGRKSFAKFEVSENKELHLLYNKTYNKSQSIWQGRSYSHELKPDISLELFHEGNLVAIIHFDAKYRLPINGSDKPDDINKMHAYKDGIMGTVGAYALCLAEHEVIYKEEEQGFNSDDLFPSVGAFPLTLNPKTLNQQISSIQRVVDSFCNLEIRSDTNEFFKDRMQRYHALLRNMMKVEETDD